MDIQTGNPLLDGTAHFGHQGRGVDVTTLDLRGKVDLLSNLLLLCIILLAKIQRFAVLIIFIVTLRA